MEINPFEYSPLYQYRVNDMLFNINIMRQNFKKMKLIINNYIDEVHNIHYNFINSGKTITDITKAIDLFKVVQQDLITNFTGLALQRLSDDKYMINYSNHNISSGLASFSIDDYWSQIRTIPNRNMTVLFDDETKLVVLNPPSIQINLDLNNRHLSLNYFTNSYSKKFQLNSGHLSLVIKFIDDNEYENIDIARFNLLQFFQSIFDSKNITNHPFQILKAKINLVLHEMEGVEKLIKLRASTN